MARWLGLVVSGDRVTAVDADVPDCGPLTILGDFSWGLQQGPSPAAFHVMYQRVANYIQENGVDQVVIKESAVSLGNRMSKAHLSSAELRGVVMAAASSVAATKLLAKARISRTFGDRKVDEYLADPTFWAQQTTGKQLRVGSREAAMILIAAR